MAATTIDHTHDNTIFILNSWVKKKCILRRTRFLEIWRLSLGIQCVIFTLDWNLMFTYVSVLFVASDVTINYILTELFCSDYSEKEVFLPIWTIIPIELWIRIRVELFNTHMLRHGIVGSEKTKQKFTLPMPNWIEKESESGCFQIHCCSNFKSPLFTFQHRRPFLNHFH